MVILNGPWKFSTGDDPAWSDPAFKDAKWESVDLAPPPGAHDADAGVARHVTGWGARGHRGYAGYAWYRLRVPVIGLGDTPLAIAGPAEVDGAYQLYVDGKLLGGLGEFRDGAPPIVHGDQPRLFQLPPPPPKVKVKVKVKVKAIFVAMRVWTPVGMATGDGGGVRMAPIFGRLDGVQALYRGQWVQTFNRHAVDAAETAALLVLACLVLGLFAARPDDRSYPWLCAALTLAAFAQANQVLFFWTQSESLETYGVLRDVVLAPLALTCWTLAWRFWLGGRDSDWLTIALAVLLAGITGLYMAVALGALPWFEPDSPAHALFRQLVTTFRVAIAALYLAVLVVGLWRIRTLDAAMACIVALIAAAALFTGELTTIGMKAIWFPFGVAVTRTEYVYAALIVALFMLILERFVSLTHEVRLVPDPDLWGKPPPHAPYKPEAISWRRAAQHVIDQEDRSSKS
ncbi:MAG: hypothetical protein ACREEB_04760 [Caulobacteraceae bacterium]